MDTIIFSEIIYIFPHKEIHRGYSMPSALGLMEFLENDGSVVSINESEAQAFCVDIMHNKYGLGKAIRKDIALAGSNGGYRFLNGEFRVKMYEEGTQF